MSGRPASGTALMPSMTVWVPSARRIWQVVPPIRPTIIGSTTVSANCAATAASTALPPAASISMPAAEPSGWLVTTTPLVPCAGCFSHVKSVPARSRQFEPLTSVDRFLEALRIVAVVGLGIEVGLCRLQHDAAAGQCTFGQMPAGIPQMRAHQRLGALGVDAFGGDDDHAARRLALHGEGGAELGIDADGSAPIDAQRAADARDQEQERNARITDDVAQRVDAVVAAPVGQHHGVLVDHPHEARRIAARRAVQALRTGRRQHHERRDFYETAIVLGDIGDLLDHRRAGRLAIERFEFGFGRDEMLHSDPFRQVRRLLSQCAPIDKPAGRLSPLEIAIRRAGNAMMGKGNQAGDSMPDIGWQVGIDIGGTFTDLVALKPATGELRSIKVPTQRNDPVASIKAALAAAGLEAIDVDDLVHGTTLVTNAIVEDRVEPVALIATQGFEDVLDIGRAGRQHLYRLDLPPKRASQVPAERRIGLAERVDHAGVAVRAPDANAIAEAVRRAKASGVESVAVSLLHAYANPAHERALGAALKAAMPFVSLSHEVNPETREFERTATTVLNASVMPIAARYLDRLQREVQGARLHVMHSAGGMASPEAAARRPLSMALSGPAAGISAAQHVAATLGLDKVLSFDMGGTTTDVCLVVRGAAEISTDSKLAGRPVRQPMVAVESIGAGGGSLVTLSTGGLSIGPESAGAEPGPAAYGRGGTRPTVTDANAVLGYLDTSRRLGGAISLDVEAAKAALEPLAKRLGVSVIELALGVQRVANATMVRALARVTVERGVDGRQCTLLAFGGAGPMHAAQLAREFGISEIVVPRFSSGFSALGCIVADMIYTQQHAVRMLSTEWDADRFSALHGGVLSTLIEPLVRQGHAKG